MSSEFFVWISAFLALSHGGLILVDEFLFHRKRTLPLWECLNHPFDTFFFGCVFSMPVWVTLNSQNLTIYFILAFLSCLSVTKDEWVHKDLCEPTEMWIHALMFTFHPMVFIGLGYCWSQNWIELPLLFGVSLKVFIFIMTTLVAMFFVYQVIHWLVPKLREKGVAAFGYSNTTKS